jgi:hypothetical protein
MAAAVKAAVTARDMLGGLLMQGRQQSAFGVSWCCCLTCLRSLIQALASITDTVGTSLECVAVLTLTAAVSKHDCCPPPLPPFRPFAGPAGASARQAAAAAAHAGC